MTHADAGEADLVPDLPPPVPSDLIFVEEAGPDDAALAVQFDSVASSLLLSPNAPPMIARQAEAMATIAVRLDPTNARLAAELVEARLLAADTKGALDAVMHLRGLKPEARVPQLQFIDLTGEAMESAEATIEY
ncbi:MAG: hypothetical protein AAGK78_01535, partial [Planctomycetota bacterium]